ncbi:hypothetical protein ASJ81_10055 [Methanosarcina spelaei]|uniref:Type I restriction modification DNA specificity domain-containing protein n=1 Tax=Methanosarcina spelaei TaxID=1036679 RepID=A0A2A2HQ78_9EURY|nr:restriction endonuclease subunit S [Methanosarcina spelaei]PAV11510.1 hypothetical protein ASJ81_10055 [Methanosarcina spelaei]
MIHNLKPYPTYKDSGVLWLGKVPEHWVVKRLKQCVERFYAGGTPDSGNGDYYCNASKGLPWLMIADMTHQRHVKSTIKAITEKGRASKNLEVLPKGTLLYSMYASLGTVSVLEIEAAINQAIIGIKTRNLELETEFTLYFLESLQPYITLLSNSSTQANLNAEKVRSLPIYIPPLPEQSAIVHYLDYIDRRIRHYIRAKKKLIKLLEEQKQAIIHQAVTRGLDPNVKLKPSGVEWLGEIPEHWEVLPLKALSTVQSGITLGKQYLGQELVEFPYLRVANVQEGHVNLSEIKTIEVPAEEAKRSRLQKGDVLMTEGGDPDKLGRGCVWEGQIYPCLHQNHIFAVRPNISRLKPYYLGILLSSQYAKEYFLRTGKQTTNLASTNKTTIGQFPIPLPKVEEQDLILDKVENELEGIERAMSGISREISILREYRTRLIADVVTGKLDVREAAANLPEETDETEVFEDEFAGDDETAEEELESEPEEE